jgi:tetratricopeptide (TPR) repeat protein
VRCDAYESKGDYDRAIQDYSQAVQLKLTGSLYSAIWRYLERELRGGMVRRSLRRTLPD